MRTLFLAGLIGMAAHSAFGAGDTWTALDQPDLKQRLDEAPALDANLRPTHGGAVMKPVGSIAVRDAILKHQPLLSVHGHIHESRGVKRMGRTLAINPGSVYGDGVLQGAVIELNPKKAKVARYLLVNG